jgi:hypothetical protein
MQNLPAFAVNHARKEAFELGKYKPFLVNHIKDGKSNEFLIEHLGGIDDKVIGYYTDFLDRLRAFEPEETVYHLGHFVPNIAGYVIVDSYYSLAGQIGKELGEVDD